MPLAHIVLASAGAGYLRCLVDTRLQSQKHIQPDLLKLGCIWQRKSCPWLNYYVCLPVNLACDQTDLQA